MAPRPAKRRRTGSVKSGVPQISALLALRNEGNGRGFGSATTKAAFATLLQKARIPAVDKKDVGIILKDVRERILKAKEGGMVKWERVSGWFVEGYGLWLEGKRLNVCKGCEEVVVAGGWLLGMNSRGEDGVDVDIAVKMPGDVFGKRDFGGGRYWWKRALWLGWIAEVVAKDDEQWNDIRIGEECLGGHVYQPFLTMTSVKEPLLRVRLIPWIPDIDESFLVSNVELRADSMIVAHLSVLHKVTETCPEFAAAVVLLKLWGKRRRLRASSFCTTSILAQLLLTEKIPQATDSNHLVRATLAAIATLEGNLSSQVLPGTVSPGPSEINRWASEAQLVLTSDDCITYFCNPRGFKSIPAPAAALFDAFITVSLTEDGTIEKFMTELGKALLETDRVKGILPINVTPTGGCFGVFLDLINASRRVDICESDNDKDSFKEFWRGKSELRRFKNKGIKQAVVWSEEEEVVSQILEYLSSSRKWIDKTSCVFSDICTAAKTASDPGFTGANVAFSELSDVLRRCENIPLHMSSIQSSSPFLRRTAVLPPRPAPKSRYVEPVEVILTFESSSAWPFDATAIAASKAAFYCSLADALSKQGVKTTPTISFLDISLSGFYFRVILRVPTEVKVLDKIPSQRLLHVTEIAPAIHDRLRVIANLSFAPAARLAKKWLASQLLLDAMGTDPELLVDVLVAHGYTSNAIQPGSPMRGFIQFLTTVVESPWETQPLVVTLTTEGEELQQKMSESEVRAKVSNLTQGETTEGLQVIVLGDYEAALCTHGNGPEMVVTRRLRSSAAAALAWLQNSICISSDTTSCNFSQEPDFRTLFVADYTPYNAVITLTKQYISRRRGMQGGGKALVGFDVVAIFVNELQKELGDYCLFLFNRYGGDKICIVWRPEENHKFALSHVAYSKVIEPDGQLTRDRKAVVQAIRRIGGDIIEDIKVNSTV